MRLFLKNHFSALNSCKIFANLKICDFLCLAQKVIRSLALSTVGGLIAAIKNPFSATFLAISKTFSLSLIIITTIADCDFGKFINSQKYRTFSRVFAAKFFFEIICKDFNEAARTDGGSAVV